MTECCPCKIENTLENVQEEKPINKPHSKELKSQTTGLYDRNYNEIFVGDLVKDNEEKIYTIVKDKGILLLKPHLKNEGSHTYVLRALQLGNTLAGLEII